MADGSRFQFQSQLEHLQMKFVGAGHADTTKHEWVTNHRRDSYASYIGHAPLNNFFAIAQNVSVGRVKYQMLQDMYQPCGAAPAKPEE